MGKRFFERLLLVVGIVCIAMYVTYIVQAYVYQQQLEESFDNLRREPAPSDDVPPPVKGHANDKPVLKLKEGDLIGRMEIPRLDLSVMVLEGIGSHTLRLAAGHIPGTPLPGNGSNAGIAGHRDSFFRGLRKIEPNDQIRFRTLDKTINYRVVSTGIVEPDDVSVLNANGKETLTLVTCYPFYFVGPAPKRFVVSAVAQ